MKTRIIIVIGILAIGFVYLVVKITKAVKANNDSWANTKYCYHEKFNREDSLLFKSSALTQLQSVFVIKSKYRNDIKYLEYKNQGKLYYIKIDLLENIPLDKLLIFQNIKTTPTTMHTYDVLNGNGADFKILAEKIPKINNIIFSSTSENNLLQKYVLNKNFIKYNASIYTFSLQYGKGNPIDMFLGNEDITFVRKSYPLVISFYKKQKTLYILLFIPNKANKDLEGNLLEGIMNDNSNQ